jgi:hypothetical protein
MGPEGNAMRTLAALSLLLLLASPVQAGDPEIVIYNSVSDLYQPAVDAAWAMSSNVAVYYSGSEAAWIADVADGADIVVFDVHSNYTDGGQATLVSLQLDAFHNYLVADTHNRGVIALWFHGLELGHPIWGDFGVNYCSEFFSPLPMRQWDTGHPIFAGVPNPLLATYDGWFRDGSMVEPTGGATAIGGFSAGPATCQAGVVVGPQDRTVYLGETGVCSGGNDSDGDLTPDWQEMYENIYLYLLSHGPTATEPSTWGSIKSLYH